MPDTSESPVVLISGASQGIGAAIARTFATHAPDARLALVARNAGNLARVAKLCAKAGATVATFPCDASDPDATARLTAAVEVRFGRVDVLINNAGSFTSAPFLKTSVEQFDQMISGNLRSAFLLTKAFLPGMIRRKTGDVFFMSSVGGLVPFPNHGAYCAAKFGVAGLAKTIRAETHATGVRVCTVYPGATASKSWETLEEATPGHLMPTADVARAFLDAWRLSRNTVVEEIVLRPRLKDL